MAIVSGRTERMWVMRCVDSIPGFSANARSEMYSLGNISVTLPFEYLLCDGPPGDGEDWYLEDDGAMVGTRVIGVGVGVFTGTVFQARW